MVLYIAIVCSFLLLSDIPLCGYTTILSVCLFLDIWIVANFWFQIKLLTKLDFPSGSVIRTLCLCFSGAWACSLVAELGSSMLCGQKKKKNKKQSYREHLCAGILVYLRFYYSWVNAYERNNLFWYEKYLIILTISPNRGLVGFHFLVHSEFYLVVGFFLFVFLTKILKESNS